ncbi:MAG: hypothetical protein J1F35_07910 [Erysipelotrichales bacterium]|nr:hypothetical protein [Erysipelotrichales bacterium]
MRNKLLTCFTIIIALILDSILLFNIASYDKVLINAVNIINERTTEINHFLTKYKIEKSGTLEVSANYRGAHGENYPSEYTYNYRLLDKLYLEDKEYAEINYDKKILSLFNKLTKLKDIDLSNCSNTKRKNGKLIITCDKNYINDILETNFKNIEVTVYTDGLFKEINHITINLDDINLTLNGNDLTIEYLDNSIKISFNGSNYYVNVNDLLKANIIINDVYSCSIVINDKVYYVEVRDNELYIKFNSQAAIYNSVSITAKYGSVTLEKEKLIDKLTDNPIANYIENSDFNIWR